MTPFAIPAWIEALAIFFCGLLCSALAFLGGRFTGMLASWLTLLAWLLFLLGLLFLVIRFFIALTNRQWIGCAVRLLAVPALLILGAISLFLAELSGKASWEVLPAPTSNPPGLHSLQELVDAGNNLAAELSNAAGMPGAFALQAIRVAKTQQKCWIELSCGTQNHQDGFSARYRWVADDKWFWDGWSAHGDIGVNLNSQLQVQDFPLLDNLAWPVDTALEEQWQTAGEELAAALRSQNPFASTNNDWRLRSWRFDYPLKKKFGQRVEFEIETPKQNETKFSAAIRCRYYKGQFFVEDVTAGQHLGASSSWTMEDAARVQSAIESFILSKETNLFALQDDSGFGKWRQATAQLPDGLIVQYHEQQAHLFLAEYNMRMELTSPDGKTRRYSLPMNTGGRTSILGFQTTDVDGRPCVQFICRSFNVVFCNDNLEWTTAAADADKEFLGAFLGVTAPVKWISADAPNAAEVFRQAAARGYPAAIEEWEKSHSD